MVPSGNVVRDSPRVEHAPDVIRLDDVVPTSDLSSIADEQHGERVRSQIGELAEHRGLRLPPYFEVADIPPAGVGGGPAESLELFADAGFLVRAVDGDEARHAAIFAARTPVGLL